MIAGSERATTTPVDFVPFVEKRGCWREPAFGQEHVLRVPASRHWCGDVMNRRSNARLGDKEAENCGRTSADGDARELLETQGVLAMLRAKTCHSCPAPRL
jgi:hypothetical protein